MDQLHRACARGDYAVVQQLLSAGANANERDRIGATPLHVAAISGHADIARLLLDHGADQHAVVHGGDTPLAAAVAAGHHQLARLLAQARVERWSVSQLGSPRRVLRAQSSAVWTPRMETVTGAAAVAAQLSQPQHGKQLSKQQPGTVFGVRMDRIVRYNAPEAFVTARTAFRSAQ